MRNSSKVQKHATQSFWYNSWCAVEHQIPTMKNALKEKFKTNAIVKPLYKKLRYNKIKPNIFIDNTIKLDGNGISVKRNIANNNGDKKYFCKERRIFLCGSHENNRNKQVFDKLNKKNNEIRKGRNMLSTESKNLNSEIEGVDDKTNKFVQADNEIAGVHKSKNAWLRLYPVPKLPEESVASVIFRCLLCQLGLSSLLILWTIIWVFTIHSFEGPHEIKITVDFEREQNLLVINLATELRQITPLSPKWRSAIEKRIEEERHLTMEAVSNGARVHPGQFWDLSGTFLFTVYVMTALGFGAPVPQTIWGRTSALIYAALAVPTHFYLMLNASMCIVVRTEACLNRLRCDPDKRDTVLHNGTESPNCSRSSEVLKSPTKSGVRKKIMRILGILGVCRWMFLIAVLYYLCGAVAFGLAREREAIDIAMFPLEFTTSGGLDRVKGHIRILYGWYVEGAVMLLSCGLATLRQQSGSTVTCLAAKYKLFETQ